MRARVDARVERRLSSVTAMRSRPGSRAAASANGSAGRGAQVGVAELVAGEHVEQRRRLGDRAGEHAVDAEEASRRASGRQRDAAARGLEPDEPAAGGRDADRAAAVVAVGDRDHARGDRRGRAAARSRPACGRGPTGCASGRSGAARSTGRIPNSGSVRGADDHEARVAQAARRRCASWRRVKSPRSVGSRASAAGPRPARLFLIAIGTPANGRSSPGADRVGGGERALGVDVDERVELRRRAPRCGRARPGRARARTARRSGPGRRARRPGGT